MPSDLERPMGGGRIPVKLHRRVCLVQTEDALLAEELLSRKKLAQIGRLAMSAWPVEMSGRSKLGGKGFSDGR